MSGRDLLQQVPGELRVPYGYESQDDSVAGDPRGARHVAAYAKVGPGTALTGQKLYD